MPSFADWLGVIDRWNRKLHYYAGLYFLFFVWLFALTGLLLNHGRSGIAVRANQRTESRFERAIAAPQGANPIERARDVVAPLGLRGEIDLPATQVPGQLTFNLSRPNDASQVRVDLVQNHAVVQHFENTGLAALRIFHTFSGSRFNQPESRRDWLVTTVWVIAMDAVAAGLIVMVLGSYVMWYRLKRHHTLGWIALASGFVACAGFLQGLMR
jgi:hypothetical protein